MQVVHLLEIRSDHVFQKKGVKTLSAAQQAQADAIMDDKPNQTLYINNLNEKVKKEGMSQQAFGLCISDLFSLYRVEEVTLCHLLPVWAYSGYCGLEDSQDAWTGICCVC